MPAPAKKRAWSAQDLADRCTTARRAETRLGHLREMLATQKALMLQAQIMIRKHTKEAKLLHEKFPEELPHASEAAVERAKEKDAKNGLLSPEEYERMLIAVYKI